MSAEEQKTKGNACYKRKDYGAAVEHYYAALQLLDGSRAANATPLRLALLTNRSLALHRVGRYAAAAADAEVALQLDPSNCKAAFRAAAARLLAGDGAAAAQHARALLKASGQPAAESNTCDTAAPQPAAWMAVAQHAQALAEHQKQLKSAGSDAPAGTEVWELLEALAAEAEGDGEAAGGPATLLRRLAALLGAGGGSEEAGPDKGSTFSSSRPDATQAAVTLEAHPQSFRLLLFFLADPDPAAQQAAVAALQAAAHAAAGGSAGIVLWPQPVWQRLAALGADPAEGAAQQAALRLLSWAAGLDPWVREQLLLHPLHAADSGPDSAATQSATPAVAAQVAGMLAQPAMLHCMHPAAVQAAAGLLRQYAADAAAAEALAQLGCQPLLALVHAARGTEGMAAFQPRPEQAGSAAEAAMGSAAANAYSPSSEGGATQSSGTTNGDSSNVDPEQEALAALRAKLRKVYIADQVALQRCLLATACQLAGASRELLLGEAVVEQGSAGSGGRRGVGAGPFLAELLALAREMHSQQPRRTAPVLGPDGNAKAYAKRRFAADFKDNPAGDFLLSMDLQLGSSSGIAGEPSGVGIDTSKPAAQRDRQPAQSTLLELSLALLLSTAQASPTTAALLHRRDVLGLCEELSSYCTPAVVSAAHHLVAAVADRVPAAAEEIVQGSNVLALVALLLHSTALANRQLAADKLAALADTCSGDDFAALTATAPGAAAAEARSCAAYVAWQLLSDVGGEGAAAPQAGKQPAAALPASGSCHVSLARLARRFLLRCCDRAQRQQRLGPQAPPCGGCWNAIGRVRLHELLRSEAAKPGVQQVEHNEEEAPFSQLKRGFFSSKPPRAAAAMPSLPPRPRPRAAGAAGGSSSKVTPAAQPSKESHAYKQGAVVIEELEQEAVAPKAATDAPSRTASATSSEQAAAAAAVEAAAVAAAAAAKEQEAALAYHQQQQEAAAAEKEEEEEIADLQDVYDSSASLAAEQRRVRADWVALPMEQKLRWTQTSLDVSVHVLLPPGTRASDVQVITTPDRLTISLKWFGRVLDGQLHLRVKPSDTHWCMEDSEVHVLLAKSEEDAWWKTLVEGGQERGYYELLKEAVDADEPVKGYDQLEDGSKRLLEAIQERQAYIQAGLIDPEGFDDFRVVIGESGLRPSQGGLQVSAAQQQSAAGSGVPKQRHSKGCRSMRR